VQDLVRFLQTFILLNLFKETGRYFMVSAAYHLTVTDLLDARFAPSRHATVAPVLMYLTIMSIVFRLEVSNYDNPSVAVATCIFQGVLEIALRLTAPKRDAWVKRVLYRIFCCAARRRRATTLIVVAPGSQGQAVSVLGDSSSATKSPHRDTVTFERVAAAHERDAIVKQFHARMLVADMWAECAGIYISSVVLFLGQSNALYYPFRPFRKYPQLFDGGNYYGELAVGTLMQIVIEIITDTVCLVFETRRGLEPIAAWRELPKAALAPIVLFALIYATYGGMARSLLGGDSVSECNHRDLCWCLGKSVLPDSVREGYCLLLYPNSSGRPVA
jgi:hypothetical protein